MTSPIKRRHDAVLGDLPRICEGLSGTYFYHLTDGPHTGAVTAICGARAMPTEVPIEAWGFVGHLNERYCKACEDEWTQRTA